MKRDLYRVYAAVLFFAPHIVLITYIHSTYLEQFVPERVVGLLYAIGALLAMILLSYSSHFLHELGNRFSMLLLCLIEMFCLLMIGFGGNPYIIILFFIIHQAIIPLLFFSFDVFVKHFSRVEESGKSRGAFLSIINSAYVVVPMVTGFILARGSFQLVYTLASLLIIPAFIFIYSIQKFEDPHYHEINLIASVRQSYNNLNIFFIVLVNLFLQFFYAAMVIYMPIYLHQTIGFDWGTIGLMFTVMLTPFVIFELPLGKISDAFLGEKELLISGLVIMSFFTLLIPFVHSDSIITWTILLFMTRVGASFVEIMSESYFFKKVTDEDSNLLSLWRAIDSFAYVVIPLIASILLFIIGQENIAYIFLIAGLICASGIYFAARIKDTL